MEIFWRLTLAHLLADFTFQTDYISKTKRENIFGMSLHILTHLIVTIFLLKNFLNKVWFNFNSFEVNGWIVISVLMFFHFSIDEIRVYLIKKLKYKDNTFNFLADQFAHFYVIFIFSPIPFVNENFLIDKKWIILLSIFILLTHFSTVLIYFIEKEFKNISFPSFDLKYFMIFERIVLCSLFFINGYLGILILFLWIGQMFYIKNKRIVDISNINLYLSIVLSIFLGVISRWIYYN